MAIEVEVTFKSGEKRWCYFMTPAALSVCRDYVPGTDVRFHYDQNHMIVVSAIDEDIIALALKHLDSEHLLHKCTRV